MVLLESRNAPPAHGANRAARQFLQKDDGAPVKGVTLRADVSGNCEMERRVYTPSSLPPLAGEGCGDLANDSELSRSWMGGSAPTGARARTSAIVLVHAPQFT